MNYTDHEKAEAIRKLRPGEDFILQDGDTIRWFDDNVKAIPTAQLEMMCEQVRREEEIAEKHKAPPAPAVADMLEMLWQDIHMNSLNKGGSFYKLCYPHFINKTVGQ